MKSGKGRVGYVVVLVTLLLNGTVATGFSEIIDRVAAIVNDQVITQSELEREVLARTGHGQALATPEIYREVLYTIIEQKLILKQAAELDVVVTEREIDRSIERIAGQNNVSVEDIKSAITEQGISWAEFRQQVREDMVRNQVVSIKVRAQVGVTDRDLQKYYEENRHEYEQPPKVRIEQVFFPIPAGATEEQRDAVALKAGGVSTLVRQGRDFHAVAVEAGIIEEGESLDLGYFNKGELRGALDQAAFSIPVGSVSDVIETPRGYVIIRVVDRQEMSSTPLEVIREEVADEIYQEKMRKRYEEWIDGLYQEAYIEIKL